MKNPTNSGHAPETQRAVLSALSHLLKPLIRLLISRGIPFQVFSELVKSEYVKVAEREFQLSAKPQTDSRISLLTGIHRREINRLRKQTDAGIDSSQHGSMSAHLLAIWSGAPEYLDAQASPLPLPRVSMPDGTPSFEALVRSVSKDFRPRVVLDEWLRLGIVTLDKDDRVHLAPEPFLPPHDFDDKVFYFGQNIHDHMAATVHNLSGIQPPFLERCVFYDKLRKDSTIQLAEYARDTGMKALHAVNKRAFELQRHDSIQADAVYRFNFGIYSYSDTEAPHETSEI